MRVAVVIPARYAATRLPGKPLADILGKPMIQHVWEACRRAEAVDDVLVATDDERIASAVRGFGGEAAMTRADHPTGTDRIAEVAASHPADVFVNVQGDEPLIKPKSIATLARMMRERGEVTVGTLCTPIGADQAADPNRVKLVRADDGRAHYFSRARIPYPRNGEAARYLQHLGIYAYRREPLLAFPTLPRPMAEIAESLEQLRFLAAGFAIHVAEVDDLSFGIDAPEDLERVRRILSGAAEPEAPPIRLLITDIDGVMTDGGLFYGPEGETIKRFDVRDGLGLRRLREAGIAVAAISGRDSAALRVRLEELGVDSVDLGVEDKGAFAREAIGAPRLPQGGGGGDRRRPARSRPVRRGRHQLRPRRRGGGGARRGERAARGGGRPRRVPRGVRASARAASAMCGITGLLSRRAIERGTIAAMAATLRHRGPDDEGLGSTTRPASPSVTAGSRSSTCRRRATSRWPRPTAATC